MICTEKHKKIEKKRLVVCIKAEAIETDWM